jgi:hypothetical protein
MNAPAPTTDQVNRDSAPANRCPSTQLSVPECSCQDCLTKLMQAYAPGLLAAESAQPALS